jgi:hypothetical protein
MKKTTLFLLLTVLVSFSACEKKEDDDNSVKIIGKWNLKKEVEKEYLNNTLTTTDESTYSTGAYVEFKSNGALEWNEDGSDPENYSYKVDGDKLTVNDGGEPEVFTIEELSSSKLVISEEDTETINGQTLKEVYQLFLER